MATVKRTPSTGDLCSDNCLVRDKNGKTKDQKDYLNHCIWAKFVVFFSSSFSYLAGICKGDHFSFEELRNLHLLNTFK